MCFFVANVPYFWTSGRLCDFDGCDRPDLFPKNINGWFWSANQVAMPPTNGTRRFHDWSHTGGLGVPQPDNREETQLHGDTESCMAVLNNYYGDGKYRVSLITKFLYKQLFLDNAWVQGLCRKFIKMSFV